MNTDEELQGLTFAAAAKLLRLHSGSQMVHTFALTRVSQGPEQVPIQRVVRN